MGLHELSAGNESNAPEVERARQNGTLHGPWLLWARCVCAALTILLLAFFIANLRVYFAQLHAVCIHELCPRWQLTPAQARELQSTGFSVNLYAIFSLTLSLFSALVWFAVAAFIAWRKSNDWLALLASLLLVTQGTSQLSGYLSNGGPSIPLAYSSPAWYVPTVFLLLLGLALYILVFSLFPNGQFAPEWMRWLVPAEIVLAVIVIFLYTSSLLNKTALITRLAAVLWLFILASIIGGQMYRYRRVSSPTERQQTKWVVFGIIEGPVLVLVYNFSPLLFPSLSAPDSLYFLLFKPVYTIVFLFAPLCFGIAILRYRLWDIDIIIHRTLVYASLSVCVIGLYVLVVVGLGSLLQAQGNLLLSLLATGLIAILFQPLRQRLQQAVNRLLYGERDDPYAVLARMSSRLEATLVPETVLPTIVETVAQTLKLPYVAIALIPEQQSFIGTAATARTAGERVVLGKQEGQIVASSGTPTPDLLRVPLVYQAETVGYLLLAARVGDTFSKVDQCLLTDLARQAGVAVYAVRLTASLQHLAESLQESRERLVTTREEERRRLRRDLHDGLGPALASLTFKVDAARNLLTQNSERAEMLLAEVSQQAQDAITDIRRLVYNLRPPALDELGLLSALREQVALYQHQGLDVAFDVPGVLPSLPAAVEVAVYRIAQEALTNVARYAEAQHCLLRLSIDAETLHLAITDDGNGIPVGHRIGVGLHTMHERASELGGSCTITAGSSGGTTVNVTLPLVTTRISAILSVQDRAQQDHASAHADDVSVASLEHE